MSVHPTIAVPLSTASFRSVSFLGVSALYMRLLQAFRRDIFAHLLFLIRTLLLSSGGYPCPTYRMCGHSSLWFSIGLGRRLGSSAPGWGLLVSTSSLFLVDFRVWDLGLFTFLRWCVQGGVDHPGLRVPFSRYLDVGAS